MNLTRLNPEQAESILLAYQAGRCDICAKSFGRTYHVDHYHFTGMIRGLLCPSCNVREGKSDGPELVAYRGNFPAKRLGIVAVYCNQFGPARLHRSMVSCPDLDPGAVVPRMSFEDHADIIARWIATGGPTAIELRRDRTFGVSPLVELLTTGAVTA